MFDNNCQACDTKHMETTTMDAKQIIDASTKQLGEFYTTTREADGNAYQLYLDIADGSLMVNTEGSTNSWLQRDDGSLVLLTQHAYPAGTDPGEESDDGYSLWVDEIERMIAAKLAAAEGFSNDGERKARGWDVVLKGKVIDTVFFDGDMDAAAVKASLVNHDGYDSAIEVQS